MNRYCTMNDQLVRVASKLKRAAVRPSSAGGSALLEGLRRTNGGTALGERVGRTMLLGIGALAIIAFAAVLTSTPLVSAARRHILPTRIVEVPVPVEYRPTIRELISRTAQEHGLPEVIVRGVAGHESEWDAQATRYEPRHAKRAAALHPNDATAQRLAASSIGIMQVMGWHLGTEHPGKLFEVEYNIQQGARILTECRLKMHRKLGASAPEDAAFWSEVLGCYNGDRAQYPEKVFAEIGKQLFAAPLS